MLFNSFLIIALVGLGIAKESDFTSAVKTVQESHGLAKFKNKYAIQMDYNRLKGNDTLQSARFIFEAHGDKAKMTLADGKTVIYDGKEAWGSAPPSEIKNGRFHVWTWPWFLIAPFKMTGNGINLGDAKYIELNGQNYLTVLQTFDKDQGDAPDDWYRLFLNENTKRLEAMVYIVSYGKPQETLESAGQSIVWYKEFTDVNGVIIPSMGDFWKWDGKENVILKDKHKFKMFFTNIKFLSKHQVNFQVPKGYHHFPK